MKPVFLMMAIVGLACAPASHEVSLPAVDASGGMQPPLAILPPFASRSPGERITFVIPGRASDQVVWSFDTNASGGNLDASTGSYTAGSITDVMDVVQVTDASGARATATVSVRPRDVRPTTEDPPPTTDDPPPTPELPSHWSAGCAVRGQPTGQFLRTGVSAGGLNDRRYSYFVPSAYDSNEPASTPLPLVFDFHGQGGAIQEPPDLITSVSVLQGDSTPGVFVFPQGLDPSGGDGYGWHGTRHCNDYDVAFFDAIFTELTNRYCIDLRRVFAGGFSFGATMTQTLACCRGDKLRAVAPHSGGACLTAQCPTACQTSWPSARYSYGTGDTNTAGGDGSFTLAELRGSVEQSRLALHCSDQTLALPTRCDDQAPKCRCVEYAGCDEGTKLIQCEYPGDGRDMHMYEQPDDPANVWHFFSDLR